MLSIVQLLFICVIGSQIHVQIQSTAEILSLQGQMSTDLEGILRGPQARIRDQIWEEDQHKTFISRLLQNSLCCNALMLTFLDKLLISEVACF